MRGSSLVLALALTGWAMAAAVVLTMPVLPATQAVVYAAGFVAIAGSWALLLELYYARKRPPSLPGTVGWHGPIGLLGSGMRLAFVVEFAVWLQTLRMLTPAHVVLLVAGFVLLEHLFRSLRVPVP